MAIVIRISERAERVKPRVTSRQRSTEQRLRYPGPDAISEVSCGPSRRRPRHELVGFDARRAN